MGSCRTQRQQSGGDLGDENQQIKVANNDDLITEILLWLPVKSLLRFKSVSKRWLHLISNQQFIHNHYIRNRPSVSGLFLEKKNFLIDLEFEFVPLDDNATRAPFKSLTFVNDPAGIKIKQSCNGLLCCCSFRMVEFNGSVCSYRRIKHKTYYIYNPTTKEYTILPLPRGKNVYTISLAFDPLKSYHYKAVGLLRCDASPETYQIEIYSSETGLWRLSGEPFTATDGFHDTNVYWNGAIHWLSLGAETSLYFNVDHERLGMMPMPPMPEGQVGRRFIRYFGESLGHLHLIEMYDSAATQFDIFEMENDYSRWFVRYRVDLDAATIAYPDEMVRNYLDASNFHRFAFSILCVVRRKEEEESFLVLHIPGKVLSYNLKDRSFKKLLDILPEADDIGSSNYSFRAAYQHIEMLSFV